MRERMQALRQRRDESTPAFEDVWRYARSQYATPENATSWAWWRLAGASLAVAVVIAGAGTWTLSARERHRRIEREFAAVDGALITYWQAPSDALLSSSNGPDPAEPK
jgi:hypothetical protein